MRAQLLIKQLTIIINSIWLREHKEVAQVHKTYICIYLWPDLAEWKVRCNGPRAKNSLGFSSKCKCNAIGQPAWFAHRIVSAPLGASGHWPRPSQWGTVATVATTFWLIEHVSLCALRMLQHRVICI